MTSVDNEKDALASNNQEQTDEPVLVPIGLRTGDLVQEVEEFFGNNVILASRIVGQAQGGRILVSSLLKEHTENAGDIRFEEVQEVELKGLAGLNRVYTVGGSNPDRSLLIESHRGGRSNALRYSKHIFSWTDSPLPRTW